MISLDSLAELHEWCATYWPKADAVQVINTYSEYRGRSFYALLLDAAQQLSLVPYCR